MQSTLKSDNNVNLHIKSIENNPLISYFKFPPKWQKRFLTFKSYLLKTYSKCS